MKVADLQSMGLGVRLKDDNENLGVGPASLVTPELIEDIRDNKAKLIAELLSMRPVASPLPGPGTELAKLFSEQNIVKFLIKKRCGECKNLEQHMNQLGVAGCVKNRECLINKIHNRAKRDSIILNLFGKKTKEAISDLFDKAVDACRYSAVWVYVNRKAPRQSGLRYSMRSAMQNLSDVKNLVLCGDDPGWYSGDFISVKRYGHAEARRDLGSSRFAKWIDSAIKLQSIIDSPDVTENFLWMYDDTMIVKPMEIRYLSVPRADGLLYNPDLLDQPTKHKWQEVRRRTHLALIGRGFPARDYSTHLPIVFNKTKLRHTLETFDPFNKARVIESLYMNQHYANFSPLSSFPTLQLQKKVRPGWIVNDSSSIVNLGRFNEAAANVLCPMFTEALAHESD